MTAEPVLATSEIQGNSLGGFNKNHQALVHFAFPVDLAVLRQWLQGLTLTDLAEVVAFKRQLLAMKVAGADTSAMKVCWQNIAFTYRGLVKLTPTATQFTDTIFINGLDGTASRTLGDPTIAGAPGEISTWKIGGPNTLPDAILIIAADDPAQLDAALAARQTELIKAGCTIIHVDPGHDPSFYSNAAHQFDAGHEHFGFRDGISQPGVRGQLSAADSDWLTPRPAAQPGPPTDPEFAQPGQILIWPGEFVFGYLKQNLSFVRLSTKGRKLSPPPPAIDQSAVAPWWAANGSFLVFRRLHQDVPAFRAFCQSVAASASTAFAKPMSSERAAALLVGRWPSGAPVRLSPNVDDTGLGGDDTRNNDFTLLDDQDGRICPLAAHIRKVNPRGVATDDGIAPHTLGHRLLRRGIPYGAPLAPDAPADRTDRGLLFLSYQTEIEKQFMFLANRWANAANRPVASVAPTIPGVAVGDGFDMVIGSNPDGAHERFFVCYDGAAAARTEAGAAQPDWVFATGGGFYFAPAISAVRALAVQALERDRTMFMAVSKKKQRKPRGSTEAAGTPLLSPAGRLLATTFALPPSALAAPIYPIADRHRLIDQLKLALSSFYVHLNRKKAIYGFDPVRALALLAPKIDTMSDAEFHGNLVELLARVRDRHVIFLGRAPYGAAAMVPFTIETCWENGRQIYVVTKVDPGTPAKTLKPGARVSHWNGIPIDRYIRLSANLFDGGNEAAALARSLAFLTHRPLNRFGPPLEEWVDLRFTLNGVMSEERFSWAGFNPAATPAYPSLGRNTTGFGGDLPLMDLQNARRVRLAPQSFDAAPAAPTAQPLGVPKILGHAAAGVIDYGTVTTGDGTFAYLRFWSFQANTVDDLVNALTPILSSLPQNGLIFDMRGNSGGYIAAGERVLQLFSVTPIVPARFEFRVTDLTRAMAILSDEFSRWRPSFAETFATGEDYTRGIPIEGEDADYNKVGRKYPGPIILVSDALAFSTADIFAAGFIDNGLGKVICTDGNMAAAGGNNWTWDVVRIYNPDFRLDAKLKPDMAAGKLTGGIVDAFNAGGVSLSTKATLSAGVVNDGDTIWTVQDGTLTHTVRDQSWMSPDLEVYLDRGLSGLADLPSGIVLSLTMRRAVRVKINEGRILEDVGIVPDIMYQMTVRDVMEQNQDLFDRAGKELVAPVPGAPSV